MHFVCVQIRSRSIRLAMQLEGEIDLNALLHFVGNLLLESLYVCLRVRHE